MKIPKYIKPGDTIGVVAPSFGATTEPYIYRFQEAIKKFKGSSLIPQHDAHKDEIAAPDAVEEFEDGENKEGK